MVRPSVVRLAPARSGGPPDRHRAGDDSGREGAVRSMVCRKVKSTEPVMKESACTVGGPGGLEQRAGEVDRRRANNELVDARFRGTVVRVSQVKRRRPVQRACASAAARPSRGRSRCSACTIRLEETVSPTPECGEGDEFRRALDRGPRPRVRPRRRRRNNGAFVLYLVRWCLAGARLEWKVVWAVSVIS